MTEICKYEAEIATMGQGIKYIQKGMDTQNVKFDKLFKTLEGNGGIGIVTQTALNKSSIHRVWWFIGAIAVFLICTALKAVLGF